MPQISQIALVYQSQWFWLVLTLAVIFFVVGRGIVPRVESTVDARDAKISAALAEAERLQADAEAREADWRKKMNDAHTEAQAAAAAAKAESARQAEARVKAADAEIAARMDAAAASLSDARRGALTEIEEVAAQAARDIVAKLTGAAVPEETARAAVAGAMSRA
jgi:F-type H+-transporting ATPase subunit b